MNLNDEIIALLNRAGCQIVGFADLRSLSREARQGFDYGVLIALPFTKEAMRENRDGLPKRYSGEHELMTRRLGELNELTAGFLADKGFKVFENTKDSIIDGPFVDERSLRSVLPFKTVATLTGIGWIGKCAVLVTKEVGSALRMTVVLTDALLDCGIPVTKSKCSPTCTACVDVCPGKAPSGDLWEAGADRDSFFNAHACRSAARARAKSLLNIEASRCGLCISNCLFTKRGLGYE